MAKVRHYSLHKPSKGYVRRRRFLIAVIVIVVAIIAITGIIRHIYNENLGPVSKSEQSVQVNIKPGSSLLQIADQLKTDGVIKSSWAFQWYVRNDNYAKDYLQAGTYSFRPNEDTQQIVTGLTDGKVATNVVVILPNQRLDQITTALTHDGFSKSAVESALNPSLYQSKYSMFATKPVTASLEGFLYPDSFDKSTKTSPETIINESLAEMQTKLTSSIVNGMAAQGLNIFQGVTLASIVGQEVSQTSIMPTVAQVFISRLHSGMSLGSDVTAYYGAILAGQKPSVNYTSPYNTLQVTGLPPGPISNVTESALEAVAHPSATDYLYFVSGDNGTTYFAQTLQQHDQQVSAYCQKLCSE
jgi:UPF0755 protein